MMARNQLKQAICIFVFAVAVGLAHAQLCIAQALQSDVVDSEGTWNIPGAQSGGKWQARINVGQAGAITGTILMSGLSNST